MRQHQRGSSRLGVPPLPSLCICLLPRGDRNRLCLNTRGCGGVLRHTLTHLSLPRSLSLFACGYCHCLNHHRRACPLWSIKRRTPSPSSCGTDVWSLQVWQVSSFCKRAPSTHPYTLNPLLDVCCASATCCSDQFFLVFCVGCVAGKA